MKLIIISILTMLSTIKASAVCPVCTVAVGAGLGLSRYFGIDDLLVAIWMGAITVSLILWTKNWLSKKGITSKISNILNVLVYYAMTFSIYLLPDVNYGNQTFWGTDKLLLGIIIGSITMLLSTKLYEYLKFRNGGKAHFAFEKVALPIGSLIIITLIFKFIIG